MSPESGLTFRTSVTFLALLGIKPRILQPLAPSLYPLRKRAGMNVRRLITLMSFIREVTPCSLVDGQRFHKETFVP